VPQVGFVDLNGPINADVCQALNDLAVKHAGAPAVNPPEAVLAPPSVVHQQGPAPTTAPAGPPAGLFGAPPPAGPPQVSGPPAGLFGAPPQAPPAGPPAGLFGAPPTTAPAGPPAGLFGAPPQTPPAGPPGPPATPGQAAPPAGPPVTTAQSGPPKDHKAGGGGAAKVTPVIGELFLDCYPHGEKDVVDLGHYVARAEKSSAGKVLDIIMDMVEADKPKALFVASHSEYGATLRDSLVGRAKRVIKGGV